jgi:hypothetical protein
MTLMTDFAAQGEAVSFVKASVVGLVVESKFAPVGERRLYEAISSEFTHGWVARRFREFVLDVRAIWAR